MTDCPSTAVLHQLLAEQLESQLRDDVARHIDRCDRCQHRLDELTDATDVTRPDVTAEPPQAPTLSRLMEQLRSRELGANQSHSRQVPTDQPDPNAPLSLADFRLTDRIGQGGMGSVYRAVQNSLNKSVAIKLLDAPSAEDDQLVARFLKEACAAASLRHPNIVDVHGIGRTPEGGYFLVMDLVEGTDLQRLVATGRTETLDPARVVATIADAIEHAHQQGVIHRDLKPSNVLVSSRGEVFVTDFGVAKLLCADAGSLSVYGQPIGTPSYMAPEQADPRSVGVSPATDVYGLGGILYFLLTGQHPYRCGEGGEIAILAQVLSDRPPRRPRELNPEVSPVLEAICLRCLKKNPAERFASASELAAALRSVGAPRELDRSIDARAESRGIGPVDEAHDPQPVREHEPERRSSSAAAIAHSLEYTEPPLGAVPLNSEFYLVREADSLYEAALARRDSIVLVRGARQMGKTSLMARGLQQARRSGTYVALTDFQKLNAADLASAESLFLALGSWLAEKLDFDISPHDTWNSRRGASVNFERFLRREILDRLDGPLVWGMDEIDRLFTCDFSSEVFGLFRSWHNERALEPAGPWSRVTLAIAYATEAHLFITDINQSPFNVGTRISLSDFNFDQVAELNRRYQLPLSGDEETERFMQLVGGQPYLVNRGLYEMAQRNWRLEDFASHAVGDEGVFGDHLRRMIVLLAQDPPLYDALRRHLLEGVVLTTEQFYRLRSAGVLAGSTAADCRPRCGLYQTYLQRSLS